MMTGDNGFGATKSRKYSSKRGLEEEQRRARKKQDKATRR
jgi:hypothetical protein